MFLQFIFFILSTVLLAKFIWAKHLRATGKQGTKVERLPPGPKFGLPFIGHLISLGKHPQKKFLEWGNLYGPVMSVQMGSFPSVIINDAQLIRKAFNTSCLALRPKIKFYEDYSFGGQGIFFCDERYYRERRQFFIKNVIRDFAAQAGSLEQKILHEVRILVAELNSGKDAPFTIHNYFHRHIVNTLLSIVTSMRFEPDDPRLDKLLYGLEKLTGFEGVRDFLSIYVPKLSEWFPNFMGYTRRLQVTHDLLDIFKQIVTESTERLARLEFRGIFWMCIWKPWRRLQIQILVFTLKKLNLLISLNDLFVAAMETTSKQLEWIMYYMSKYPEIQTKVQDEIDHLLGHTLEPSLDHRSVLIYTEAMIQEALRKASITPLALMHMTGQDYELNGYVIPQGTVVIGNLFASHHNPQVWGDPENFSPERFIDPKGKLKKIDDFIPFSIGKRNCLGEILARHQLFLYVVTILQKFRISAAGELPSEDTVRFGITVAPHPFDVIFRQRV